MEGFVAPDVGAEARFWAWTRTAPEPYRCQQADVAQAVAVLSDPAHAEDWQAMSHLFTLRVAGAAAYLGAAPHVTGAAHRAGPEEERLAVALVEAGRPAAVAVCICFFDRVANVCTAMRHVCTARAAFDGVRVSGVRESTAWELAADTMEQRPAVGGRPLMRADPNEWAHLTQAALRSLAGMGVKGNYAAMQRAARGLRAKAPQLRLPDVVRLLQRYDHEALRGLRMEAGDAGG